MGRETWGQSPAGCPDEKAEDGALTRAQQWLGGVSGMELGGSGILLGEWVGYEGKTSHPEW